MRIFRRIHRNINEIRNPHDLPQKREITGDSRRGPSSRRQRGTGSALRRNTPELQRNARRIRRVGIRIHDSRIAQNRDPAGNAEHRIQSLFRKCRPLRDLNQNDKLLLFFPESGKRHILRDHAPRSRIDGIVSDRHIQPAARHHADPLPAAEKQNSESAALRIFRRIGSLMFQKPYGNMRTGRHVGVVAAILHHNRMVFRHFRHGHGQKRTVRQSQPHLFRLFTGYPAPVCSTGCRRGGASGRVTASKIPVIHTVRFP